MLTYQLGPITITVTLDESAPVNTWLQHLSPHVRALHTATGEDEVRAVGEAASTILATPGMTYTSTPGGGVLDLRYPAMFRI
ncbi:hypothetical protein [Nocardia suismassiliense]|uniref:hypothetical protein n=1 Tax=Nocardia suismassiliense TaxID=2077092 RepID=UPI000D1DFBE0|nr:hypothetical protein [Nocardia suismassiliense]